jgi:hypothetical protein
MSNPTTPFGWQMPTNTDLVTDLPADFEVFGQAVATSLADLNGGTTGQVLAKASNADMDFVWSADAAGMTNPMTTTGDIIYSSPGSTPVRLGIGSAGQVMTVSGGGVPSWATSSAGGMTLISTTSLAGSNLLTLSSIPQTYNSLFLIIKQVDFATGSGNGLSLRLNGNSNLTDVAVVRTPAQTITPINSAIFLSGFYDGMWTSEPNNVFSCNIFNYTSTDSYKTGNFTGGFINGNFGKTAVNGAFGYRSNSAVTSIDVYQDGSTWSGGTVLLYGVK